MEYASDSFSETAKHFASGLLTRDPTQRLGAKGWKEVEKHAFFSDFDFEALRNATMPPPFVPDETLNAKDSNDIGEHETGKTVAWNRTDELKFKDWDYFNDELFEEEVIHSLKWAKEHGDLRMKRKSSTCGMM